MGVCVTTTAPRVAAFRGRADYREGEALRLLVHQTLAALELPDDFIRPGDRVVLKPNWVKEHDERRPGPGQWEHMVTHPAVIEAVAAWVAAGLRGRGSVIICDAPQGDSSFARLSEYCGLTGMVERCRQSHPGLDIRLLDLRTEELETVDGVTVGRRLLPGDPLGSTFIALNEASEFVGYQGQGRLYGASFDMAETNAHHRGALHEYLLCRTPMEADVFINLPKLKTHKKVGLTCALKNLVGINANKNWLPHHTEGTPEEGGDQFPAATRKARLERQWMGAAKHWLKNRPRWSRWFVPLKKAGRLVFGDTREVVRSGNWHGNDTCWRMVLDINKCLFFFNGRGERLAQAQRYLALVDGIVGGEGDGPMTPDPKPCGALIAGTHPVAVDCVAAALMGFDWRKLRLLANAFHLRELNFVPFRPEEIQVVSNQPAWQGGCDSLRDTFNFRPHFGWRGAIEKKPPPAEP